MIHFFTLQTKSFKKPFTAIEVFLTLLFFEQVGCTHTFTKIGYLSSKTEQNFHAVYEC